MKTTPVSKPYLPSLEKYAEAIKESYDACYITNNGPLLQSLESRLEKFLDVSHVICVGNGTLALQLAYRALDLKGEAITTPFSFVATSSSLVYEGITPVFSDIRKSSFNLNPDSIEEKLTGSTSAIVPVHVYGNPCEVAEIDAIARARKLRVVYDASHAFSVSLADKNILKFGDISTLSFHATKAFHTIEGGAICTESDELAHKLKQLRGFGIDGDGNIATLGVNAKLNEFQAAMGLCVLDDWEEILKCRRKIWSEYERQLNGKVQFQEWHESATSNYSYAPILFNSSEQMWRVKKRLESQGIIARQYFFPSLDEVDIFRAGTTEKPCKNSRNISSRILCLPIFPGLNDDEVQKIINTVLREV